MAHSKYYLGLEIGTTNIKMVVAEIKPDLSVKVLAVSQTKSAGVRKGEILDTQQANACIHAAIVEAEDVSGISVDSVFLAVTGGHIRGVNNRATLQMPSSDTEITNDHIMEVEDLASDTNIPQENAYIHTLATYYRLDGQEHRIPPSGLIGKTLEAEFHLVHGIKSRVQNTMRVARENAVEIEDIVFAPVAAAQVALTREQKDEGALVLDIGGGTTDYILYVGGYIHASGCIPIGGDHITNDIHLVTSVPTSKAEELKIEHGDASGKPETLEGVIQLKSEFGLNVPEVENRVLNGVIRARIKELLKILVDRLPNGALKYAGAGVFLTGGVSKTIGIEHIIKEQYSLPVHRPENSEVSGNASYLQDPQLATVLGLIYYAQILDQQDETKPGPLGFLSKLFGN